MGYIDKDWMVCCEEISVSFYVMLRDWRVECNGYLDYRK